MTYARLIPRALFQLWCNINLSAHLNFKRVYSIHWSIWVFHLYMRQEGYFEGLTSLNSEFGFYRATFDQTLSESRYTEIKGGWFEPVTICQTPLYKKKRHTKQMYEGPFAVKARRTTLIFVECITFHQTKFLDDVHKVLSVFTGHKLRLLYLFEYTPIYWNATDLWHWNYLPKRAFLVLEIITGLYHDAVLIKQGWR